MQTSILQAIVTKYLGPTNTLGSRIKATAPAGGISVTIPYPHHLNSERAHRMAAEALCDKLSWPKKLLAGGLENGFVFIQEP